MTKITIKKENGSIVSFEISGHTGYADEGSDIVCASLSSVVWCTVNGLINVLHIPCEYSERDGHLSVKIPNLPENTRKEADFLLKSMDLFFDELISQYGSYITKSEV